MARDPRERLTLVIDQESARLMSVRNGLVTGWGSTRLPPGAIGPGGAVADGIVLADALTRLSQEQETSGPARENVLLAIPGNRLESRLEPLDDLPPEDLSAIGERARSLIPRDDAVHAWQLVGDPAEPYLFVAAAPVALLRGYVAALARARLRVVAIDIKMLALIRGVARPQTLIVDAERGRATLVVVEGALPSRVHYPLLAAPLLTASDDKVTRLAEAVGDVLEAVRGDGGLPWPIYLTGALAEHPLLRDVVRDVLGHPLGIVRPQIELPPAMPVAQFVANLGLAYKRL